MIPWYIKTGTLWRKAKTHKGGWVSWVWVVTGWRWSSWLLRHGIGRPKNKETSHDF